MAIRLPGIPHIKRSLRRSLSNKENSTVVPKGHIAVYVGENEKRRFVVPISYLTHPSFQDLLNQAEEEFGFNHPMGGLTIPCNEDSFIELTSQLIVS
ncbi:Auxin-responsive protein saur21 [Thalictrum thalictroides]|uniref:Auxin-responsive protein saur21 n=1 Tax=Thalictrum thalictroides TaxID=46969 RepID=A0A7J6WZJ9_THATH|nr:Auxin-responsive protein saur21 [Thalictrum thalictroides]